MSERAKDSVFLLGGARFKLSFQDIHCAECGAEHDKVTVDPLGMYASDLQGTWVALVPAENDAHLYLEELKQQRDELLAALKKISEIENRYNCGDWDEIEDARNIAKAAIAKVKK